MSLKERFETLDSKRSGVITTAEKCAELTLRYLFPRKGVDNNAYLGKPWQSVGARGVNNLASKMLIALLPPDGGFFRYTLDPNVKASLEVEVLRQAESILALSEEVTLQALNNYTLRHTLFEALKHVIITGNVALWVDTKKNRMKLYNLRDYVVTRDKAMNLTSVILKESVDVDVLPPEVRQFVLQENLTKTDQADSGNITADEENPYVTLYTGAKLIEGKWEMWQEVEGVEVPKSRHQVSRLPILVLRWSNNIYGRGMIEQVLGDLDTLETLTKAVTEGSIAASRVIFMVKPATVTNASKLARARNASIIEGNPDDVGTLQMNKYADFRVALERIAILEQRLNQMFLIFQPRQAERVTAEEIRRLTEELEALLGGVYTLLAEELQKPLLELVFASMQEKGKIPKMPKDDIHVTVLTGFEALSRTTTLNKLLTMLNAIASVPDALQYIQWDEYLARVLNSLNINPKGLVKTQEQLQAEQQAMMQQQTATQVAGQQLLQQDQNSKNL